MQYEQKLHSQSLMGYSGHTAGVPDYGLHKMLAINAETPGCWSSEKRKTLLALPQQNIKGTNKQTCIGCVQLKCETSDHVLFIIRIPNDDQTACNNTRTSDVTFSIQNT